MKEYKINGNNALVFYIKENKKYCYFMLRIIKSNGKWGNAIGHEYSKELYNNIYDYLNDNFKRVEKL